MNVPDIIDAARQYHLHSPSFPSVGVYLMAFCGLSSPFLRLLPSRWRSRILSIQTRLTGDGTDAVHCAELVVRLFNEAGCPLLFERFVLDLQVNYVGGPMSELSILENPTERLATRGSWIDRSAQAPWKALFFPITSPRTSLSTRWRRLEPVDWADFVTPIDIIRSPGLELIADLSRRCHVWHAHSPTRSVACKQS